MTAFFLESFWSLLICCLAVMGVLLFAYRVRTTQGMKTALLITPLVLAILLIINVTVETDREGINKTLNAAVQAFRDGDAEALRPLVADNFTNSSVDHDGLIKQVDRVFKNLDFQIIWLSDRQIEPPNARIAAQASFKSNEGMDFGVKSSWELSFVNTPDGWKLSSTKPLSVNNIPYDSLEKLLGDAASY